MDAPVDHAGNFSKGRIGPGELLVLTRGTSTSMLGTYITNSAVLGFQASFAPSVHWEWEYRVYQRRITLGHKSSSPSVARVKVPGRRNHVAFQADAAIINSAPFPPHNRELSKPISMQHFAASGQFHAGEPKSPPLAENSSYASSIDVYTDDSILLPSGIPTYIHTYSCYMTKKSLPVPMSASQHALLC